MRKKLQIALMASPVLGTFLSLAPPCLNAAAASGSTKAAITTTDDNGRKVYVNESFPPVATRHSETPSRRTALVFWSTTEHRWKPIPSANIRAARSAAAEVNHYLG